MVEGSWMSFLAVFALFAAILSLLVFPTGFFLWTTCFVALGAGLAYLACIYLTPGELRARMDERGIRRTERIYTAILIFLLLTLLPLPLGMSRMAGKERYLQNRRAAEAVETACELELLPPTALFFAHTRNKAGTLRVTFMAIAMFGAAMLAALLSLRRKVQYARFIAMAGAMVAAAGLLSRFRFPQGDTLWWIYPIGHGLPGPVAGFTSPNHFGAFLAIVCPVQLGLLLYDFSHRHPLRSILGTACFLLMSGAIVVSCSRGSFIALIAGVTVSILLTAHRRLASATAALGIFGAAVIVGLVLHAGPEVKERLRTLQHITRTDSYTTRLSAWSDSFRILRHYPLAGAGANAFRMVYPQHRSRSDGAVMTHAENEYIQILVDGGLAGAVLFLLLCVILRRDSLKPALGGAYGATVLVAGAAPAAAAAVHSLVDFPLHIPVYSVTLASLVGMLAPFPRPRLREVRLAGRVRLRIPMTAAANIAIAAVLAVCWGRFARLDSATVMSGLEISGVRRALVWAPTSSEAWQQLGRAAVEARRTPQTERFRESCVARAVEYDPNNYRIWYTLGLLRDSLGDRCGAAEAFARTKELRDWYDVPYLPEDLE